MLMMTVLSWIRGSTDPFIYVRGLLTPHRDYLGVFSRIMLTRGGISPSLLANLDNANNF